MLKLNDEQGLFVHQRRELGELMGFETRNKYEIHSQGGLALGFAAEQHKGILGFLGRQFFGHWRPFEIVLFDQARRPLYRAIHPFRFVFQRIELHETGGRIVGAVQQRFALFSKRFDIEAADGSILFSTSSAPWKIWTFPIKRGREEVAVIRKKWAGLFSEAFTDKDQFHIAFQSGQLTNDERLLILAAALFIDLQYFEKKAD